MTRAVCRFANRRRSRIVGMIVVAGMTLIALIADPQKPDASDGTKSTVSQKTNKIVADEKAKPVSDVTTSFKKQILPLLSKYCFECHGKDEQHGSMLRL